MRPWSEGSHRRTTAAAVAFLLLGVTAVAVRWRLRDAPETLVARTNSPPVITIAWRSVGEHMEPWSGVGLGAQVREALNAQGVMVTGDGATSAEPPPGGADALAALGREHNATYVLSGTVGRKGARSEIGMQLVRVQDGVAVWASTFWRDPSDLESLPWELAGAVAQVLEAETSRRSDLP